MTKSKKTYDPAKITKCRRDANMHGVINKETIRWYRRCATVGPTDDTPGTEYT